MKEIRKYIIEPSHGVIEYWMPAGAELLHIGLEDGVLGIWFLTDPSRSAASYEFFLALAGRSLPDWCCRRAHRGTFEAKTRTRTMVMHVFERSPGDW